MPNQIEWYLVELQNQLRLSNPEQAQELLAEVRGHLDDLVDEQVRLGAGRAEAERTAVLRMGPPELMAAEAPAPVRGFSGKWIGRALLIAVGSMVLLCMPSAYGQLVAWQSWGLIGMAVLAIFLALVRRGASIGGSIAGLSLGTVGAWAVLAAAHVGYSGSTSGLVARADLPQLIKTGEEAIKLQEESLSDVRAAYKGFLTAGESNPSVRYWRQPEPKGESESVKYFIFPGETPVYPPQTHPLNKPPMNAEYASYWQAPVGAAPLVQPPKRPLTRYLEDTVRQRRGVSYQQLLQRDKAEELWEKNYIPVLTAIRRDIAQKEQMVAAWRSLLRSGPFQSGGQEALFLAIPLLLLSVGMSGLLGAGHTARQVKMRLRLQRFRRRLA